MIITGLKQKPFNVLLYGTAGIGKSSWAAEAPDPLFITGEEIDELGADRLPKCETFDQFKDQLKWLLANKTQHKTLVVDTLDSIEKLLFKKILSTDSKQTGSMGAAHGGYGKAYDIAESEWMNIKGMLTKLRDEHGYNLILLAHSQKITATDTILGMSYDTFETALHKKAQAVFVDWVSCVFFATYVAGMKDDMNSSKTFAVGHGERTMLTEKRPAYLAKNRFNLPHEMPLVFSEFYSGYAAFFNKGVSAEDLAASCVGMCENVTDVELKNKMLAAITAAGTDVKKLTLIKQRIIERVG